MVYKTGESMEWSTRQERAWNGQCPCEAQTNKQTYHYNHLKKRLQTGICVISITLCLGTRRRTKVGQARVYCRDC
jgi:hypothetical protein